MQQQDRFSDHRHPDAAHDGNGSRCLAAIGLSRHSADLCFRGTRPGRHGRSEKGNLLHWKTVCSEVAVGNCKPILQLIPYATQTRCTAFIEQRSTSYMSSTARIKKSDLAYYIHDGPAAFRFQLSGDVSGAGVRNLEQTWRTASSAFGGRSLVVDLTLVTGIDHAGRELLEKWRVEGAGIVVSSSAAKDRIESMMDLPITLLGKKTKQYA